MKKTNYNPYDEEVSIGRLLIKIWREKIIFFSIIIILSFLSIFYSLSQPKIYRSILEIRPLPFFKLKTFPTIIKSDYTTENGYQNYFIELYNSIYQSKFLSLDSISEFLDQHEESENFNSYLKENNLVKNNYFRDKIKLISYIDFKAIYSLETSDYKTKGIFFDNYAHFIQKKSSQDFKIELSKLVLNKIESYNHDLQMAKLSGIEFPVIKTVTKENTTFLFEGLPNFYKGIKILESEIRILEKFLNDLDMLDLNFNPILQPASKPLLISIPTHIFLLIGLISGMFLSTFVILTKYSIQQSKKINN